MRKFIPSPAVTIRSDTATPSFLQSGAPPTSARWLPWLTWMIVIVLLFYQLGSAALFEPDEGRNAEKAREILVLNDWITPHENFHTVLDKPIFFYWLIAISYELFGASEWAARVPSALAALGSIALVYRFARRRGGQWPALWSALILVTSVEFFVLARVVIFDMTLTFFITLALYSFYEAVHTEGAKSRRMWAAALYVALAGATLVKGLVGVAVPGLVIFFYLLITRRWSQLRRLNMILGAALFLAIVAPWYLAAEARNPGYLYYYFWEEHFSRFATAEFDRAEPWYYFIGVGWVGFVPWTILLPLVAKEVWQDKSNDTTLYWILWVALPFLFFSVSKSKLPHYILPIFPPLAMLAASALVRLYQQAPTKLQFALSLTWWLHAFTAVYLVAGLFFPLILARQIRGSVSDLSYFVWGYAALSAVMLAYLGQRKPKERRPGQTQLYGMQGLSSCVFLALVVQMMISVSSDRSAKAIAETASTLMTATTQLVYYDTYLAGVPFYLSSERPFWLITHEGKKRTFLGNYYARGKHIEPVSAWGTVILDFAEFRERWKAAKEPLLVVVKEKKLPRFVEEVGESPVKLAAFGEYLLVERRRRADAHGD